jgi:hypothetical protein
MERVFNQDFSRVRVHADGESARSAEAVGARAYTVNKDVVFGSGEWRPQTSAGKRLLAHELAHVVQQSDGPNSGGKEFGLGSPTSRAESEADRAASSMTTPGSLSGSPSLRIRERLRAAPTIQRAVATWAGSWDTDKYAAVNDPVTKKPIGADIVLRFKPGADVNSTLFGMVQMVTTKDLGKVVAINPTVGARSIPKGTAGEGAHIDQLAQFGNPLYATGAFKAKDKLGTTPTHATWGQHGWRFLDKASKLHKQDSLLKDTPTLPGHGANASQIFEVTALAVGGVQEGTYYGSVRWGWQTDAANKFTKLPLSLVSNDVPSKTFAAAVPLWGANKTSLGKDTIPLPLAEGMYTNVPGVWLVGNPAKFKDTIISKLAKNTRLEVTHKGPAWSKVTIVAGGAIGKVGWVAKNLLSDKITK